jgi:hypothetical protein
VNTEPGSSNAIEERMHATVRRLRPRTDPEALLASIERRHARQRRAVFAVVGLLLVGAVGAGFFVGRDTVDGRGPSIAVEDGTPGAAAADVAVEPANVERARAAVIQAFHDAYTGSTSQALKDQAIQNGAQLAPLVSRARSYAQRLGVTSEQLAGTSIDVSGVVFIDDTHAAVRFTLSVPPRGPIMVDRIGYAVFIDGRWRVSLRTACDILSLTGLGERCPPGS